MLTTLYSVVNWIFKIYYMMMLIYILLSWFPQAQGSPIGNLLGRLVEPYLSVFRRFIPPLGMLDISPIVAFFTLYFVESGVLVVISWIYRLLS